VGCPGGGGWPDGPTPRRLLNVPAARATLSVPRNWALVGTHNRQLLVVDTSGGAVIALWRYPVHGPAPQSTQQLQFARRRLIATARTRDASLRVISSNLMRVDGHPALALEADERIGAGQRHVISTHVWDGSEELVLEEYAPPEVFGTVNRAVFAPVLRSLKLTP